MTKAQKRILSVAVVLWLPIYLYLIKGFCTSATSSALGNCAVNNLFILPIIVTLILALSTIPLLLIWKKGNHSLLERWSNRDYLIASGFFILGAIFLAYLAYFSSLGSHTNTEVKLSDKPIQESTIVAYPDEPNLGLRYKISSSSAWLKPINSTKIKKVKLDDVKKLVPQAAYFWQFSPEHLKQLNDQHLDKKYQDYFFEMGEVPGPSTFDFDINQDGIKDKGYFSFGEGCGGCADVYIDLFVNEFVFSYTGIRADVYPRSDSKGFYLTEELLGKNGFCCPENVLEHKFEWDGSNFTETAVKTVWISPHDLTSEEAIQLVKNLPEVKKYLKNHQNEATESGVYYSAGTVDIDSNRTNENFITVHVYQYTQPLNQNFGMTQSFNSYTFDGSTGKIKCELNIFDDNGNYLRNNPEFPCPSS